MIEISKCKKHQTHIDFATYKAFDFPDYPSMEAIRANLVEDLHDQLKQATIREVVEDSHLLYEEEIVFYGHTNEEDHAVSRVCLRNPNLILYSFGSSVTLEGFAIHILYDSFETHIPEYKETSISIEAYDGANMRDIDFSVFFDEVWKIGFYSKEDYFQALISQ